MVKTLSDAINIMCPYNMERLLYFLTNKDSSLIKAWYSELEANGKFELPELWVGALKDAGFQSARVDDEATKAEMVALARVEVGYVACPHACVAFAAAKQLGLWPRSSAQQAEGARPCCVMATASPCKFRESVTEGLGAPGWETYAAGPGFPASAREIMAKPEVPPTLLTAAPGEGGLNASQRVWEGQLRDIVVKFSAK